MEDTVGLVVDLASAESTTLFPRDYVLDDDVLVRHDRASPPHDYSDGEEVEQRIGGIIAAAEDRGLFSHALHAGITDWPSLCHLSAKRANLLRPFADQLAGRRVLEVGAGCGAISRYLGELANGPAGGHVVSLESSQRRAGIARLRTADLPAVQIVCDDIFRFLPEHPFDVVVVVGVLEYARLFYRGPGVAEQALLDRFAAMLRPGGLMLLAIENQLGLKYMAGAPEDHLGVPYAGIDCQYRAHTPVTFGRRQLAELLQRAAFPTQDFYLPFPDYKLPTLVISPRGVADAPLLTGRLAAETAPSDQDTRFSLQKAWTVVARNGLLTDLANSFLIAARTGEPIAATPGESSELAWYYSVDRNAAFAKETRFLADEAGAGLDEEGRVRVVRAALAPGAPLQNLPAKFRIVSENYLPHETWWFRLVDIIGRSGWTLAEFSDWVGVWLDALIDAAGTPALSPESLVDGRFIDATPFNLIVPGDRQPIFIDQEVTVAARLPLGYIAVRSLWVSIFRVAHIAPPATPDLSSPNRIVMAALAQHGILVTPSDLDRYAELEATLMAWVGGAALPSSYEGAAAPYQRPMRWHIPGASSGEQEARQLRTHVAGLEDERVTLQATVGGQAARIAGLEDERVTLQATVDGQAACIAGLEDERVTLQATVDGQAACIAGLEDERVTLQATVDGQAVRLNALLESEARLRAWHDRPTSVRRAARELRVAFLKSIAHRRPTTFWILQTIWRLVTLRRPADRSYR